MNATLPEQADMKADGDFKNGLVEQTTFRVLGCNRGVRAAPKFHLRVLRTGFPTGFVSECVQELDRFCDTHDGRGYRKQLNWKQSGCQAVESRITAGLPVKVEEGTDQKIQGQGIAGEGQAVKQGGSSGSSGGFKSDRLYLTCPDHLLQVITDICDGQGKGPGYLAGGCHRVGGEILQDEIAGSGLHGKVNFSGYTTWRESFTF